MQRIGTRLRGVAGAWLAAMLVAACGGSGGGSNPPSPPAQTGSGLLPPAAAPGESLYADATVLRPLRDATASSYRGLAESSGARVSYTNVVIQHADGAGFREDASNGDNAGPSTGDPLSVSAGTVKTSTSLQFVEGGPTEQFDVVELRSPLRVNDRYVHFDRHFDDAGTDLDGDKINEAMDTAIWSDVIGEETLDLQHRSQLKAVRVDLFLRTRLRLSKSGEFTETQQAVGSTWYAPGVGVVKSRSDTPSTVAPDLRDVITEELVTWDGIDTGLGALMAFEARVPAGLEDAGAALPSPLAAVAYDSHVVVLTALPRGSDAAGFALTQMDLRGQVVATASYRYVDLFGRRTAASSPRLVRAGEQLRVVLSSGGALQMLQFDNTGQRLETTTPVVLLGPELFDDDSSEFLALQAAADGFWMAWLTPPEGESGENRSRLVLQRRDAAGSVVRALQTLGERIDSIEFGQLRMAASSAQLTVSWQASRSGELQRHYAVLPIAEGVLRADTVLDIDCGGELIPHALQQSPGFACTWAPVAGLVALDGQWAPVSNADGSVRVDNGLPDWWLPDQGPVAIAATTDSLTLTGRQVARLHPTDLNTSGFTMVGELPQTNSGLNPGTMKLLARIPEADISPKLMLPLGNRVLLLGDDCNCTSGKLRSQVVWRQG